MNRRIDAHHHVWDLAVRDQPWTAGIPALRRSFELAQLLPSLAAHDFDGTVLVQTVCVPDETPELLALAATHRPVAGVVGWVDLTLPGVADRLAVLRSGAGGSALVGIRHQVQEEADPWWLCRAEVRRGLAAVAESGLAYDLVITPDQLAATIETVAAVPELSFVLDHAGKPRIRTGEIGEWREAIRLLAELPNVVVKLSGLVTEADRPWTVAQLRPYAEVLLDTFGPARLMYGSDWPVCLLAATYDEVIEAAEALTVALSPAERQAVFGATACRVYGLGPA